MIIVNFSNNPSILHAHSKNPHQPLDSYFNLPRYYLNNLKMRLLSIHMFKWREESPIILGCCTELSFLGYVQRRFLREHINFAARTVCGRANPGDRTAVHLENDQGICYVAIHPNKFAVTVVCDTEYPQRVAFSLIAEIMNQFFTSGIQWENATKDTDLRFAPLEQFLKDYQNPASADKLMRIESELNSITEIMHKNIEQLLKRGETLETLMQKSQDLSTVSYDFYKRAKKNNQCCKLY